MTASPQNSPRENRLLRKILIPFFIILSTLGAGATTVSVLLISDAISHTADERLSAFQEVAFREIKQQEDLLATYAEVLDLSFASKGTSASLDLPAILQKRLEEDGILASIYPADRISSLVEGELYNLLHQALQSDRQRYRFLTELGPTPSLTLAAPLHQQGRTSHLLLLQTPMDQVFLSRLANPFKSKAFIFASDGRILVGDERNHKHPSLDPNDIEQLLSGERVFKTVKTPFHQRHLYSAVPLGTSDVILLSLELPMTDLRTLVQSMAAGSVVAITLALFFGAFVYYRLITRVTAPTRELVRATRAVGRGDLDYRIEKISSDELGEVATAFNNMMSEIGNVYEEKFAQERELTKAHEELRYKEILEQKNQEIERKNNELNTHLNDLSALLQLNQSMISTLELNALFERILQVLKEVTHCDALVLLLYNPGAEELEVRKSLGLDTDSLDGVSFRLDEGISGQAARNQEMIYLHDLEHDIRGLSNKGRLFLTGSLVTAPMVVKNRLMGVLNLHKKRLSGFTDSEVKLIQAVANQAAIAIENAQLYDRARTLSNTDELTALANRRYFQEILGRELAQAKRYGSCFSVVMADIDHFKRFNDSHGHLRGDSVLKKVAALFLQNTRGIDLVARFGGEEFVVLLPKTNKEGARAAAEKLRQCIAAETFTGANQSQPGGRLTLSLGVAEYPSDSKDGYELIDLADRALYHAKERGRNVTVAWNDQQAPIPDLFTAVEK